MFNNEIVIRGNLARDPFVAQTQNGRTYTHFTVACNKPKKKDGTPGGANYVPCTAFGKTAELIGNKFKKGSAIMVQGYYNSNRYQDQMGEWKNGDSIMVENIASPLFPETEKIPFNQFGTSEPDTNAGGGEPIPF